MFFQVYYRIFKFQLKDSGSSAKGQKLNVSTINESHKKFVYPCTDGKTFDFLNLSHTFIDQIDWNYLGHGKLWTYHLNYFDYLNHSSMDKHLGLELIDSFYNQRNQIKDGFEPYPLSLRCINWIEFFNKYDIHEYDGTLFDHYRLLYRSVEFHLMGNHLLENAISLAFGAIYFQEKQWAHKANKLLTTEIAEQILDDGAHFELSPMYHSIILVRLAHLYEFMCANPKHAKVLSPLEPFLLETIESMASWLNAFQFSDGSLAWVNDASISMMPGQPIHILDYLSSIGIKYSECKLGESGYRKLTAKNYELLLDVGKIGPEYQPGHAHADSLNYVLYGDGKPLLVDVGTSTYEKNNKLRAYQRSSLAHNCVTINDKNSSDVWSSFRVGRRAKTVIHSESDQEIVASHDGYVSLGIVHRRGWKVDDVHCTIKDQLFGDCSNILSTLHLHFHPDLQIRLHENRIVANDYEVLVSSINLVEISLYEYPYAIGFNRTRTGMKAEVLFSNSISTSICKN